MDPGVGPTVPPEYTPAHKEMLLFRYIETLSLNHASRIIQRWPAGSPVGEYASKVLRELPGNYFQQPRLIPAGVRYVYVNGVLELRRMDEAVPMQQLHPDSTLGFVGMENKEILPSPTAQRRLRPLNSFMIFRSFCSSAFPGIPQKVKSMAISEMWQDDVLKEQWAIFAKAYTILRDHFHVINPSLPAFVRIATTMMGFMDPQQYINVCGWKVKPMGTMLSLQRICPSSISNLNLTSISITQVIKECLDIGFAVAREEEWQRFVYDDGHVFAVDLDDTQKAVAEPQDWVMDFMPQWPTEEYEPSETYSFLDPYHDKDIRATINCARPSFDIEFEGY